MKSNKNSKKNFKHSDIEKNDIGSQFGKAKKDKSTKKRLSIYDEFDDEPLDELDYQLNAGDSLDEDDEY
ncbi:hypothetical protein [Gaoshiqia sediminis]|uniref:Uncharacterized protein n=1 Tax=Gaoshiqia sediminis TaxID=2986998 RepID=A0AA42C9G6_9BACT|nr:hypothetical protein [Gaoshiqia sediminis]MCW0482120.1 hypothetical protein [Gaoshiqia sediminis]